MAFCMKLKLPKFKVNQRIGAGIATRRDLPRGRKETTFTEESQGGSSISDHDHAGDIPHNESQLQQAPIVEGADASLHTIKQKAVTAGWDDVRSSLLKAAVESSALPTSQCCIKCPNPATHRCIQCGALAYYCRTCFEEAHSVTNLFHVGEVWEVSCNNRTVLCYSTFGFRMMSSSPSNSLGNALMFAYRMIVHPLSLFHFVAWMRKVYWLYTLTMAANVKNFAL